MLCKRGGSGCCGGVWEGVRTHCFEFLDEFAGDMNDCARQVESGEDAREKAIGSSIHRPTTHTRKLVQHAHTMISTNLAIICCPLCKRAKIVVEIAAIPLENRRAFSFLSHRAILCSKR